MNDDTRSQRRGRPRRRPDGGGPRRQAPRPVYQGRRNNYATGGYSSIFAGPFPREGDEPDDSDLVLKLLDVVPLTPAQPRLDQNGQPGIATGVLEIVDEGFAFLRRHGVLP